MYNYTLISIDWNVKNCNVKKNQTLKPCANKKHAGNYCINVTFIGAKLNKFSCPFFMCMCSISTYYMSPLTNCITEIINRIAIFFIFFCHNIG